MQCFIDNIYQGLKLASINRGRLYLQVINLLDITTGHGYHIERSSYTELKNQCVYLEYLWPVQGNPGKAD